MAQRRAAAISQQVAVLNVRERWTRFASTQARSRDLYIQVQILRGHALALWAPGSSKSALVQRTMLSLRRSQILLPIEADCLFCSCRLQGHLQRQSPIKQIGLE